MIYLYITGSLQYLYKKCVTLNNSKNKTQFFDFILYLLLAVHKMQMVYILN